MAGTTTLAPDQAAVSDFEQRLLRIVNDGALALMISVGHRTGLFDALAATGPATVDALAGAADLHGRYVEEWLGAMVAGGIVDTDPEAGTYVLPPERRKLLTRASAQDNMAVFAQYVGLLGSVEDGIVDCFRNGGGLPYEAFPRFHEIMEEDSAQAVVSSLRDAILPLVPGLEQRLEEGIDVVDVGCGRGRALNQLAEWFPRSRFTGIDLSAAAIAHARATAHRSGLPNVRFVEADAVRLGEVIPAGSAELVTTFDAVHDQVDPRTVVRRIAEALAPDGVYLAVDIDASGSHHGDIDHPLGPLLYTISCMHCMTVSLAHGGAGLGAMWGRDRAFALFADAGFSDVQVHTLDHDPQNAYYVCRR